VIYYRCELIVIKRRLSLGKKMRKKKKLELHRRVDAIGLAGSDHRYSDPERTFLAVLQKAVGSKYYVLGKVKVLDVISFTNAQKMYPLMAAKMLDSSDFDYLICDRHSNEIVCVVELEEVISQKGLKLKWQRHRESLIQDYCIKTSLARLIVQQQSGYLLNQLIERFESVISDREHECVAS